ncbi:hypothetical protein, partial [Stenotrophomonas lacuserhaii]|uniref:hypothetical protein n=1 Tax=Stenotrophomonas lacuserhaii TaxID=2760084 RepID=UPI001CD8E1CE
MAARRVKRKRKAVAPTRKVPVRTTGIPMFGGIHQTPFPHKIRRPWVGATEGSMATMDLSKVGRGGLAGALSAMD